MPEAHYSLPDLGRVQLNLPDLPPELLLKAHVPGLVSSNCRADWQICYNPLQAELLQVDELTITLGGLWDDARRDDIPHLLYAHARRMWIKRQLYPMHAAAVGGVLLAGHSGAGKTTISNALAVKVPLASGNKSLLRFENELQVVAGTPVSSVLQANGHRVQQEFAAIWPMPVKAIILVQLNDGAQDWRQLSAPSALHTLLPLCLDAVNADVLTGGAALYDGNVSVADKQKLAAGLHLVLESLPVYRAAGSLHFMTEKIGELL